jgi:hypothetical protein
MDANLENSAGVHHEKHEAHEKPNLRKPGALIVTLKGEDQEGGRYNFRAARVLRRGFRLYASDNLRLISGLAGMSED